MSIEVSPVPVDLQGLEAAIRRTTRQLWIAGAILMSIGVAGFVGSYPSNKLTWLTACLFAVAVLGLGMAASAKVFTRLLWKYTGKELDLF